MDWKAAVGLDDIAGWCDQRLGARPSEVVFEAGHLSRVVGLVLADGREVVVKVRRAHPRLESCHAVQAHLWDSGYPCPEPIAGPSQLGEYVASAEALVRGGDVWPEVSDPDEAPALLAHALAALVERSPRADGHPALRDAPPWTAWDHPGRRLWPPADDTHVDLNDTAGPAWIDDAAQRVRARLAGYVAPEVIGHGDFYYDNLSWKGTTLHAVHDWDSLVCQPEPAVAGLAAGVCGRWASATIEENEAFLRAYVERRSLAWSEDDWQVAWATGLWLRAFDARKQSLDGRRLTLAPDEADERLRRAGA